jgi:hypothetical protein
MLAATTKLCLLARFLAVLTAVLSVRTVLWDHALAAGVSAFIRVRHERITSRSLYASEGRITTSAPAGQMLFDALPIPRSQLATGWYAGPIPLEVLGFAILPERVAKVLAGPAKCRRAGVPVQSEGNSLNVAFGWRDASEEFTRPLTAAW